MNKVLINVRENVEKYGALINVPSHLYPTYGYSDDGTHPHIEIDDLDQLFYVIVERGEVLKRDLALNMNHLLYMIFRDITFWISVSYEVEHRIMNEDFRRQLFAKQVELLGTLDVSWAQKMKEEINDILKTHPYVDDLA